MNILMISPNIPYPMAGYSTRNYHILKALASRHSVSLFALNDRYSGIQQDLSLLDHMTRQINIFRRAHVAPKRLEQLIAIIRRRPHILNAEFVEELQKAIDEAMKTHFDLVLFESSLISGYRLPAHMPVIIDQHNLEYEIFLRTSEREKAWPRKWYNRIEGHQLKAIEIERCRKADALLVTSEREYRELKQLLPQSVIKIVPNGVDTDSFNPNHSYNEIENRIVFTGALDYYPNIDAILFFAQHCWPRIHQYIPTATWQIVGKNPPPQICRLSQVPGIIVTGSVPQILPYLAMAQVAIAPILIGSGTRLKILEAFAAQKAVVSTSTGCEGLEVEPGRHLALADRPETFAQEVITLLQNPEQRSYLGKMGRRLVEEKYSWQHCTSPLLELLDDLQVKGRGEHANTSTI
jgi:sugar transferase (PEP-CTERM/EpsH1 system associated)